MANKIQRFSTFNGMSSKISPSFVSKEIQTPGITEFHGSQRDLLPWRSFPGVAPIVDSIEMSLSSSSINFCDYDECEEDESGGGHDLEDPEQSKIDLCFNGKKECESIPIPAPPTIRQPSRKAVKPKKSRLSVILLDQGLFTVYKRLFVVCFAANITALAVAATGNFPYAKNKAALFSIANIFVLTLCRSEAILRVVFWLAVQILGHSWVPITLKTLTTSLLQSLGGIHSSCGISSIAWLIYSLVLTLTDMENNSREIIGIASAILSLLCLSSLAAFPLIRHLHHNVFERTHRFAGWTALSLLWAFILLKISFDPKTKSYRNELGSKLLIQQEFWLTLSITILIIIPWITVRRVPVKISSPSGHAAIIKFQGGVKPGILGRISPSPLSEWHAFGIISDGKNEHMMLAGAVGDFTKSLVSKPPSHLWVRRVHFAGLPYLLNMYDRALVVATGSGICVFLSFILQPCSANVSFLWVANGVEQNFGKEFKAMMSGHPKDKVIIHDTALLGRPNVSQLSVDTAMKWGAEVVIVTSNPEGSRDVVNSCKAAGIPAFGPIWDS